MPPNTLAKVTESYEKYINIVKKENKVPVNNKTIEKYEEAEDSNAFLEISEEEFSDLKLYNNDFLQDLEKDLVLLKELNAFWKNNSFFRFYDSIT